jgi:LmbE family N-acetylglucosaminyl deacetylase
VKVRLAGVFAHPDDDAYLIGGSLLLHPGEIDLTLIFTTSGGAGPISDPALATRESLAGVREQEQRTALEVFDYGHARVEWLHHPDYYLPEVPLEKLVQDIEKVLLEVRPHVVVTFGHDGLTSHHDHMRTGRAATEAFFRARSALNDGHVFTHLYYVALARSDVDRFYAGVQDGGFDYGEEGRLFDITGVPDDKIAVRVDTRSVRERKLAGMLAHATQMVEHERVPEPLRWIYLDAECFVQAYPSRPSSEEVQTDLLPMSVDSQKGSGLTRKETRVERPVYFDAWFPRQHCYHPSLPPRRLKMVDDLVELRATMLVWSCLGGGSISLPYLEQEAFGEVDARFRFYGFVNDSEFIAACRARDIKVFGIVFEVQGWEFPVQLDETESRVLALNEVQSGKTGWMGLREFSQNRYPRLWRSFESYFPGGLHNSDGEKVTDLLEECCSRDIHGRPCRAHWVEVPDRDHYCYTMDRNNPVWREYLKAIIRIQIDAGVDGVQLDEAELPITSMQYGGCFCKDCIKGFRNYLRAHPERLPPELRGDLADFHYGEWLLEQGYDFKDDQVEAPLFMDYLRFQRGEITRHFAELADYARSYARSRGRDLLVSGNFFNLQDHYLPLEPSVDVIVTEMRNTTYRQPAWYRYAAGFARDKPLVIVENPYGGIVPELVKDLQSGRGFDLLRMSLYEAAALGASMSVPYGAWMGSVIEDSFWPPHDLCKEIQEWLAAHEELFGHDSAARTAVVFSARSNFVLETRDRALANNTLNLTSDQRLPFWVVCELLSDAVQPYDVVFFPDGGLRSHQLTAADLERYSTLVLPHCHELTEQEASTLITYLNNGGRVTRLGPLGANLDASLRERIESHPHAREAPFPPTTLESLIDEPQVRVPAGLNAAININRLDNGVAVHLIRYDYDRAADEIPLLDDVELEIELEATYGSVESYGAPKPPVVDFAHRGRSHLLHLRDVPLYSVLVLRHNRSDK